MIKSVELSYIQSHLYSLTEFAPGVNVITGTSDEGKSVIVRGIRSVCKNRPARNVLISNFKKKKKTLSYITVEYPDGIVTKEMTNTINQYIINGDEEHPYKAIRTDVPDTVKEITRMSSLNFQLQHDPYFLLNKSPGQVAREFNELANLQVMDSALVAAASAYRDINNDLKDYEVVAGELENGLEKLNWLDSAQKLVEDGQELEATIKVTTWEIDDITKLIKKIIEIDENLEDIKDIMSMEDSVNAGIKKQAELDSIMQDITLLKSYIVKLQNIDRKLEQYKNIERMYLLVDGGLEVYSKRKHVDTDYYRLEAYVSHLKHVNIKIDKVTKRIQKAEAEFHTLLKKGGVCPLCNQRIQQ